MSNECSEVEERLFEDCLLEIGELSEDEEASDEGRGEHEPVTDRVGLKAASEIRGAAGEADEPEDERGECNQEQED